MFDLAFAGLAAAYLWFGSKVDQWVTISMLGFKLEVPQGFLEHPRTYDAIRSALLAAAAGCLFVTSIVPWYVGVAILGGAWFATTWIGQRRAFAVYRAVWQEGIQTAATAEERAFGEVESKKSNAELRDRLLQSQKLFAQR